MFGFVFFILLFKINRRRLEKWDYICLFYFSYFLNFTHKYVKTMFSFRYNRHNSVLFSTPLKILHSQSNNFFKDSAISYDLTNEVYIQLGKRISTCMKFWLSFLECLLVVPVDIIITNIYLCTTSNRLNLR